MANYLGLDYGERRIGIALGNSKSHIAHPFITLLNNDYFIIEIKKIIEENRIKAIIIGLPRGLDGQITKQTLVTREFAKRLKKIIKLKIIWQDEAGTSKQVQECQKDKFIKKDIDKIAAATILQDYLDSL